MNKYPFRVDLLTRTGMLGREARSHTFETLREARRYIRDASRRQNYVQSDLWCHLDTDTNKYDERQPIEKMWRK